MSIGMNKYGNINKKNKQPRGVLVGFVKQASTFLFYAVFLFLRSLEARGIQDWLEKIRIIK